MLTPGHVTDAGTLRLTHSKVPIDQIASGSPSTGLSVLDSIGGAEVGVWEMSPGAMHDVEADEIFVVLSGAATVEFVDDAIPTLDGLVVPGRSIRLSPGDVVRLSAGTRTLWTVTETLRKLYLS
jgi:uncharacterized cupin superfamily protein